VDGYDIIDGALKNDPKRVAIGAVGVGVTAASMLGGAAMGAALGVVGGPVGIAVGAVAGYFLQQYIRDNWKQDSKIAPREF
jgi:hypothetical protein